MEQPIAYAMRNAEAVNSLIFFNSPSSLLDWSFSAIEWIVYLGCILALSHAWRSYKKQGSPAALYTLAACFLYGLLIDITSYYTVNNFWHGEFSVMFLHNRLPLYIALFYPAFLYHIYMTIRRYEFGPWMEMVSTGFFAGLIYLIFDNLGPLLGWWIWDRNNPTTWPLLASVPLTSYHWMMLFTAAFAYITRRFFWQPSSNLCSAKGIAAKLLSIPFLTCIFGTLIFIPYNILAYKVSLSAAGLFHALVFGGAALLFVLNFRSPAQNKDKLLMVFPFLWIIGLFFIYIAKWPLFLSLSADGASLAAGYTHGLYAGNLFAILGGIIGGSALVLASHPSREQA